MLRDIFVHNGERMIEDLRAKIQKYLPEVYKGISSEFPIAKPPMD